MTVPSSYSAPIPLDGDRVNHLKNEQNAAFGDIPVPAGATAEGDWEENVKLPGYSRSLTWASYDSSDDRFSVAIDGIQQFDGSYTRRIGIWGLLEGDGLTSSNARELAALLITAADAMDRLA